ncbi:DUF2093 domain-containing protein [Hyphomicrobium sp.]|uniref:DUF2093 domain-containing protein n=1 Tax=Hyphomicrobium sp. TaxID=82 RepID=UPI001D5F5230|nr:DUF2093 domain-containing protein [Hyphomicrobium sp.]MBY0558370.1 DUF2093 domain-containing protein [Hyphomicrobium sp.]
MNRIEKFFGLRNEAKIRYLDGEFEVMSPGDFVRCAVTAQPIALPDLRYWSVDAQEAYASAEISAQRYLELNAIERSNTPSR